MMKASFKVHAGLALALGALSLLASAVTLLPGESVLKGGGLLLAIEFALLFPLFLATLVRGIALEAGGVRLRNELPWRALRCLPIAVRCVLVVIFSTGVALTASSMLAGTSQQAGEAKGGRYYAIQVDSPTRERVEVSKREYDDLLKKDRRAMHAITSMLATGAATMTLIIGQLHPTTGHYLPPPRLDMPA